MDISREGGGSIQFHSFWIFDSPNQMRIHGKHRANFTNSNSDRTKYSSLRFKNEWCFFFTEKLWFLKEFWKSRKKQQWRQFQNLKDTDSSENLPAGGPYSMTTAYGPYIRIISVSHKPTGPIGVYQVFKSLPNDPRLVRTWRGFLAFIKAFQMNHQLRWSPTWIWRRLWGNFPPDVIILLYGGCFFFDILSQLGSIGAPLGMAFIWPARTARFHPPNMMIVSKTSQMTALNGL